MNDLWLDPWVEARNKDYTPPPPKAELCSYPETKKDGSADVYEAVCIDVPKNLMKLEPKVVRSYFDALDKKVKEYKAEKARAEKAAEKQMEREMNSLMRYKQ